MNLQKEVVLPEVQPGLVLALEGDAGAVGRQSTSTPGLFDSLAGFLVWGWRRRTPGAADDAPLEGPGLRQDMDGGCAEVLHELVVPVRHMRLSRRRSA